MEMWNKIRDGVGPGFLLATCIVCSTIIAVAALAYVPDAVEAWNATTCGCSCNCCEACPDGKCKCESCQCCEKCPGQTGEDGDLETPPVDTPDEPDQVCEACAGVGCTECG
tara:strand:+ start:1976 stop:2308 length:333 start_codon:yes stop_codon:yes gene_type:complete